MSRIRNHSSERKNILKFKLVVLVIFLYDSASLFAVAVLLVIVDVELLLIVVNEVLPFICLFSFKFATKEKIELTKREDSQLMIYLLFWVFFTSFAPITIWLVIGVIAVVVDDDFDWDLSGFELPCVDEKLIELFICKNRSPYEIWFELNERFPSLVAPFVSSVSFFFVV